MPDDDLQYVFKSVKTLRGREGSAKSKWQRQGWELVSESRGTLQTELSFRRVKSKTLGAHLADLTAAFRRLQPKAQLALAGTAALVLVAGVIGIVVGAQGGSDSTQPSAASVAPSEEPSEEPTSEPAPEGTEPIAAPYVYEGPEYEIVATDEDAGMGKLEQYWVYTNKLDYSTDAYQEQIKLLIADVALTAKTSELIVQITTDKEIIEAESNATIADFTNSHDSDYWAEVMVPKEESDWVAIYTGGIDYDAGELSDSDTAFGIDWWPGAAAEHETWRPEIAG